MYTHSFGTEITPLGRFHISDIYLGRCSWKEILHPLGVCFTRQCYFLLDQCIRREKLQQAFRLGELCSEREMGRLLVCTQGEVWGKIWGTSLHEHECLGGLGGCLSSTCHHNSTSREQVWRDIKPPPLLLHCQWCRQGWKAKDPFAVLRTCLFVFRLGRHKIS